MQRQADYHPGMGAASASDPAFAVGEIEVERIRDLRWTVLRASLPRASTVFPGDDQPTSIHLAACRGSEVVGCASFMATAYEDQEAYQLRGMATAPAWQRQGLGRQLLTLGEELLRARGVRLLWCNARLIALGFYQGQGWEITSPLFEVPTAGAHHRMIKRLAGAPCAR